ncbi:MAG: FAD-dependent oxidoreductase [Anaerolineales bacterium]|nr:FAD-dependent oxidoreductase [Anaerolineales bacterium]
MTNNEKIIVLGGGIGGLSAGYYLAKTGKYQVTVLEKTPVVGGLCASFEHNGFTLDYGAHKIYSVIPGVLDEIKTLMGDELLEVPKKNRLFLKNHLVDYPLKLGNIARVLGPVTFLKIGFGYGIEILKGIFAKNEAASYEEYMLQRFGRPAYELIFEPLADKVWGDPGTLHPEMARTRVPASGGLEIVLKMLGLRKETAETNAEVFFYPRKGFGAFPQKMAEEIIRMGGEILVNAQVSDFQKNGNRITTVNGAVNGKPVSFETDYVVSSIPIPLLGKLVYGADDSDFKSLVADLQFRHVILVYTYIKQDLILEDQWIFFPEKHLVFSRIFEQKQMNPELGPVGHSVLTADFTTTDDSDLWNASNEELVAKVIDGLVESGFIQKEHVEGSLVTRHKNFYPRYDLNYVEKVQAISDRLSSTENLLTTGRIGMYNYNNSDHCVDMGKFIADHLSAGEKPEDIWRNLQQRVADYKIVD